MLLDMVMPGMHGIEVLRQVRGEFASVEVIVLSALQSIETVIEAINLGAFDYVSKPFVARELALVVDRAIELRTLKREISLLRESTTGACTAELIGTSPAVLELRRRVRELADECVPFLVLGERGTGKELFARAVHWHRHRDSLPFTVVRCADLARQQAFRSLAAADAESEPTLQPELLGLPRQGFALFKDALRIEPAHQAVLGRLIETLQEAGVCCAATGPPTTTTALDEGNVDPGFYRTVAGAVVFVPPLRHRYEDIKPLAEHFLADLRLELNAAAKTIRADAIGELETYGWPGNVRELRNFIERILILNADIAAIERSHLPDEIGATAARALSATDFIGKKTLKEAVNDLERRIITDALRRAGGVQTRASQILGTTRRILRYRMQQLGIE
jgi:two-component system response regulator AtoC